MSQKKGRQSLNLKHRSSSELIKVFNFGVSLCFVDCRHKFTLKPQHWVFVGTTIICLLHKNLFRKIWKISQSKRSMLDDKRCSLSRLSRFWINFNFTLTTKPLPPPFKWSTPWQENVFHDEIFLQIKATSKKNGYQINLLPGAAFHRERNERCKKFWFSENMSRANGSHGGLIRSNVGVSISNYYSPKSKLDCLFWLTTQAIVPMQRRGKQSTKWGSWYHSTLAWTNRRISRHSI